MNQSGSCGPEAQGIGRRRSQPHSGHAVSSAEAGSPEQRHKQHLEQNNSQQLGICQSFPQKQPPSAPPLCPPSRGRGKEAQNCLDPSTVQKLRPRQQSTGPKQCMDRELSNVWSPSCSWAGKLRSFLRWMSHPASMGPLQLICAPTWTNRTEIQSSALPGVEASPILEKQTAVLGIWTFMLSTETRHQ